MIATAVGFLSSPNRVSFSLARTLLVFGTLSAAALVLACAPLANAQAPDPAPAPVSPSPASAPPAPSSPAPATLPNASASSDPIAIVPIDASASVTGAMRVSEGKALIATSGTVTAGAKTTEVVLPHRGMLRVCASTSVHLSEDVSVPAGETPGLMMALDHGAVETSFATGQNSDILLTPDFRILIGAEGASEVKVRLGQHGDTCIDNPGANAPYVVVSSVFGGGAYRVQPGQRVMFQHGSLNEVVDQEKEPCGCPAETQPGSKDFPLAQSAGLTPLEKPSPAAPAPSAAPRKPSPQQLNEPLVYTAPAAPQAEPAKPAAPPAVSVPPPAPTQPVTPAAPRKKQGFFRSVGRFFRKIFGAD